MRKNVRNLTKLGKNQFIKIRTLMVKAEIVAPKIIYEHEANVIPAQTIGIRYFVTLKSATDWWQYN